MTLVRPTLSALIERARADIESRLPGADSRLRHSVLDVLARVHAGAAAGLYGYLANIADQIMPDTANGQFLARHVAIWGLRPKAAVAAVITATATGTNGSVIISGTQVSRSDGAIYATTAAATITAGRATITLQAVDAGLDGDVAPGAVLTFTAPVPGVNATVSVVGTSTAGAEEEDLEALRARLLRRIRTPPQGGAASDYVSWALEQPGVTRAWPYPGWLGAGTVGLTFVMDDRPDPVPLAGDVLAVQEALDQLRPVTAALTVFAPLTRSDDLIIAVTPSSPAVQTAIEAELQDFYRREAEPGGTIHLSRIGEAISQANGEFDHRIIAPAGDFIGSPGVLPVLGNVTFA